MCLNGVRKVFTWWGSDLDFAGVIWMPKKSFEYHSTRKWNLSLFLWNQLDTSLLFALLEITFFLFRKRSSFCRKTSGIKCKRQFQRYYHLIPILHQICKLLLFSLVWSFFRKPHHFIRKKNKFFEFWELLLFQSKYVTNLPYFLTRNNQHYLQM